MANGLLASANLTSTSDTIIYTAPVISGASVVAKIFVCNRNGSAISMRLAIANPGETAISSVNAIEFDVPVPAFGVIERGNIILGESERIIARTNTTNVSVVVCGVESTTTT